MKTPEIFISYAWGGDSEAIVNELDKVFQQKGVTIIRDKRDLGFKGEITDFMKKIEKQQNPAGVAKLPAAFLLIRSTNYVEK